MIVRGKQDHLQLVPEIKGEVRVLVAIVDVRGSVGPLGISPVTLRMAYPLVLIGNQEYRGPRKRDLRASGLFPPLSWGREKSASPKENWCLV